MTFFTEVRVEDLMQMKCEMATFPKGTSYGKMCKPIKERLKLSMREGTLHEWLVAIDNLPDEAIAYYGDGKLGKDKMYLIGSSKIDRINNAYKASLVEKTVSENLTLSDVRHVIDHVYRGKSLLQAVEIVQGKRPEKEMTKGGILERGKIVQEFIRAGLDYRKYWEMILLMGPVNFVERGQVDGRIIDDTAKMIVAVEDMRRFLEPIRKKFSTEILAHYEAETGVVAEASENLPDIPFKLVDESHDTKSPV